MPQFKRHLTGFLAAAALAALLCVTAQTAKADNLNNSQSQCYVTFTVSHPDTIGGPGEYVTQLVYTPPPGFVFKQNLVKGSNAPNFKAQVDATRLVLTMPQPPNQFPKSSTVPSSFQFQIGIMSQTLACNYGTQDLQDMLVKTSLSDGYITTSRFASDGLGNVAGGTGTPAADIPAAIDPTKFTQLAGAKPCSPDTEADQKLVNGCPDPAQVGAADGDPAYEGGQLGGSPANRSCAPSGALATLLQNLTGDAGTRTVTAHVPNGTWATSSTGVQVVPIEPTPVAAPVSVLTANPVNSCASNAQTGQTVCAANNTDIYLLSCSS